jgi:hypothetical protein
VFADWALVVAFYAALHYTKAAILRDHNETSPTHVTRYDSRGVRYVGHNDLVREYLRAINTAYRDLFDLGLEARYRDYFKIPGNAVAEVRRQRKGLSNIKMTCGYAARNDRGSGKAR